MLTDRHGRTVRYLRLSVTDRCNLACVYCGANKEGGFIPHEDILTYEEMLGLAQTAKSLGITKLRLTGGEPFARRDFLAFLGMLREDCPGLDVRITTNATLMAGKAPALKHLGVGRVNISLDTLDPARFAQITGRDFHGRVLAAIEECLRYGLKVKINAVAVKGVTERELPGFLDLAASNPVDVRFIELMPIGSQTCWSDATFLSADDILGLLGQQADLTPIERKGDASGPARMYSIKGGQGRIGLITPMSNHFCATCNRLRVRSDGRLRTCLFSDKEFRLRGLIRNPRLGWPKVERVMRMALENKPVGHDLLVSRMAPQSVCNRRMSAIGG